MTCLYYATAITTTQSKAAKLSPARRDSHPVSSGPGLDSLLSSEGDWGHRGDLTAPVLFERKSDAPQSTAA